VTKARMAALLIIALGSLAMTQTPRELSSQQAAGESPSSKVDKLFAQWDKPDSAGCAIGVVKDRKLIYAHGYGMADLEHNVPITPRSAFDIASMSKQFTAMAILLLVQQGKISLDDDVRKYVPEVPDYGVTIAVRHLLYHTSGLRNHFLLNQLSGWRWGDLETRADALDTVARQKELNFKPGEEHSYTNTGYFLLGEIVQRVSGLSLRDFADRNIFKPLGMSDTQIHDDVALIIKNRAWGYGAGKDGAWVNNITRFEETGDSNMYTSIEDLARWDQNFYDGKVGGEAVIRQMLKPGTLDNGRPIGYAAGLRLGEYKGLKLVWHAGSSTSRSEYLRFPDQHFSVFCLCNTGAIDPSALARQVADIYLDGLLKPEPTGGPPSPEARAKAAAEVNAFIKEHSISVPEEKLSGLAGFYVNPDDGNARRLIMKDGKLMFGITGAGGQLAPIGENRFLLAGVPQRLEISFKEPWPGTRLMAISSRPDSTPFILVYAGTEPANPAGMAEYAGTYQSAEADATVTMAVWNNKLVLRTRKFEEPRPPGDTGSAHGWFPLDATCADAFKNQWIALLRFTRDSKKQITGFVVNNFAGGVRHLQFAKAGGH
jgi:CubicO group peptidase (beta-lactamase class C family)